MGGAYGKGVVFERGTKIGYCDLSQATIGPSLGGQTYTEIIVFENKAALDDFKAGNVKFAGQATAVGCGPGREPTRSTGMGYTCSRSTSKG